jgi:hypothetical protein
MPKVKFVFLNENGEEAQPPIDLQVEEVPQQDNFVGLFDRCGGVVLQVAHRFSYGQFRSGKLEQEITITLRAAQ